MALTLHDQCVGASPETACSASDCDVTYTQRKYVRKVSRKSPGLVSLSNAKTVRIRLDPKRLDRLLGTRKAP